MLFTSGGSQERDQTTKIANYLVYFRPTSAGFYAADAARVCPESARPPTFAEKSKKSQEMFTKKIKVEGGRGSQNFSSRSRFELGTVNYRGEVAIAQPLNRASFDCRR